MMSDDFSSWKSAMEFVDTSKEEEKPTREFKSFSQSLIEALEQAALGYEMNWLTESPIETLLGSRIALHLKRIAGAGFAIASDPTETDAPVILQPQYQLGRFRYDFALLLSGEVVTLIECDGKEFHSQPDQIENDKKKNEAAAKANMRLMRFTGAEIHKDVDMCVRSILVVLGAVAGGRKSWPESAR